jgi:hypothetical protein
MTLYSILRYLEIYILVNFLDGMAYVTIYFFWFMLSTENQLGTFFIGHDLCKIKLGGML